MNLTRLTSVVFGESPWFERHRRVALVVGAAALAAVFATSVLLDRPETQMLYALPVALLAIAFGRSGGIGAAAVAVILLSASAADLVAWATAAIAITLLGVLLGDATDRLVASERVGRLLAVERERLEEERRRRHEALELHDTVVQGLAAGIWMLDVGNDERALEALTSTMHTAQHLVTELLGDDPVTPGALIHRN